MNMLQKCPVPVDVYRLKVAKQLMMDVLAPYKEHTRYLLDADILCPSTVATAASIDSPIISAIGAFSISESCYIDDTGHFNAVEYNICFNQLAYVMMAQCLNDKLIDSLHGYNYEFFRRKQLSSMLIAKFTASYKSFINSRSFNGQLDIRKISSFKGNVFLKTECRFFDSAGGLAMGDALLVCDNH